MMKKFITMLILLVSAGLILCACAGNASDNLKGSSWRLVSYGPKNAQIPAAARIETRVDFKADGRVSGSVGCNSFGGNYSMRNGKITFDDLFMTEMACDEPRMTQESISFQVMRGTVPYQLNEDTLIIYDVSGALALILVRK